MNTRRDFLMGAAGVAALAGCRTLGTGGTDENLSVLISDLHVGPTNPKHTHQHARLQRVIDEILAMSPRPKRVICFGDIALSFGLEADYAFSKPMLKRLVDAGIDLHLTMGNHDRRSAFFKSWPEYAEKQLVPGRLTQVISLGDADLVLLDTLKGTDVRAETDMGPVEGTIDAEQLAWFENFVALAKRPFFVGSHQFRDLYIEGEKPIARAAKSRHFAGWIFGHDHEWCTQTVVASWKDEQLFQTLCLPSTGHWGDIGYVTLQTTAREAVFEMHQSECFFYFPKSPAAQRLSLAARVRDNDGQRRHFVFDSVCE